MNEPAKKEGNIASIGSALAIRAEQESFSRAQIEALRKMYGWDRIPQAELSVFFHQAQRTGLDPFARQIYLIGRRNNRQNRTDYTIQTSIDGMRLVADRTGRYAGSDRPTFGEDHGDKYAEVTVWKIVGGTRVPFTGVSYEVEFRQDRSPMWQKMPRTMLAKCAEAQALRKAFPADLSGIYGDEEMHQAGQPVNAPEELGAEVDEEGQVVSVEPEVESHVEPAVKDQVVDHAEVVEETPAEPEQSGDILKRQIGRIENLSKWIWGDKRKVEQKVLKGHRIEELDNDRAKKVIEGLQKTKERLQASEAQNSGEGGKSSASQPAGPITDDQLGRLREGLDRRFGNESEVLDGHEWYQENQLNKPLEELTAAQANEVLTWLDGELAKAKPDDGVKEAVEGSAWGGAADNRGALPATKKQLNFLESLIEEVSDEEGQAALDKFERMTGKPISELTREEASDWISRLSGRSA